MAKKAKTAPEPGPKLERGLDRPAMVSMKNKKVKKTSRGK